MRPWRFDWNLDFLHKPLLQLNDALRHYRRETVSSNKCINLFVTTGEQTRKGQTDFPFEDGPAENCLCNDRRYHSHINPLRKYPDPFQRQTASEGVSVAVSE